MALALALAQASIKQNFKMKLLEHKSTFDMKKATFRLNCLCLSKTLEFDLMLCNYLYKV